MSKKYTTVAIAYDFDGTLAKGNIQENSFIPELDMSKEAFLAMEVPSIISLVPEEII
jgi:hypothetical protein